MYDFDEAVTHRTDATLSRGCVTMVNYRGLFVKLAEKGMRNGDLVRKLKLSEATVAKFAKGGMVGLEILCRIALLLNCDVGDLVSVKPMKS